MLRWLQRGAFVPARTVLPTQLFSCRPLCLLVSRMRYWWRGRNGWRIWFRWRSHTKLRAGIWIQLRIWSRVIFFSKVFWILYIYVCFHWGWGASDTAFPFLILQLDFQFNRFRGMVPQTQLLIITLVSILVLFYSITSLNLANDTARHWRIRSSRD